MAHSPEWAHRAALNLVWAVLNLERALRAASAEHRALVASLRALVVETLVAKVAKVAEAPVLPVSRAAIRVVGAAPAPATSAAAEAKAATLVAAVAVRVVSSPRLPGKRLQASNLDQYAHCDSFGRIGSF